MHVCVWERNVVPQHRLFLFNSCTGSADVPSYFVHPRPSSPWVTSSLAYWPFQATVFHLINSFHCRQRMHQHKLGWDGGALNATGKGERGWKGQTVDLSPRTAASCFGSTHGSQGRTWYAGEHAMSCGHVVLRRFSESCSFTWLRTTGRLCLQCSAIISSSINNSSINLVGSIGSITRSLEK